MEYNALWDHKTLNKDFKGVHLTLTFDQSRTLGENNAAASLAFNGFMSYLIKHLLSENTEYQDARAKRDEGQITVDEFKDIKSRLTKRIRPPYIKVVEFQDNGNIHLHVHFFGINWIDRKGHYDPGKEKYIPGPLDKEILRLGFGKISYVYATQKEHGLWRYAKAMPKDAPKDRNVRSHLKKYLEKALDLDNPKVAMYWLTNKRFFTNARVLHTKTAPLNQYRISGWIYIGSWNTYDIPIKIYQNIKEWDNDP